MKRILYSLLILLVGAGIIVGCGTGPDTQTSPSPGETPTPITSLPPVSGEASYRVILSHDGHPDPDDNGALLAGSLAALDNASKDSRITLVGIIYGDTTKARQDDMVRESDNPTPKVETVTDAQRSGANYIFYKKYGKSALESLTGTYKLPANFVFEDITPQTYNFNATELAQMTTGGQLIANEILKAIEKRGTENIRVVVSTGGGENASAEAIAYLYNKGYQNDQIMAHFAVIQHSNWNWQNATEAEARNIVADFTIRIEDQNKYTGKANDRITELKTILFISTEAELSTTKIPKDFTTAWIGAIMNSGSPLAEKITNFKGKDDVSDAGSHHFATNSTALDTNWGIRNNNLNAPANKVDDTTIGTDKNPLKYDKFTINDCNNLLKD